MAMRAMSLHGGSATRFPYCSTCISMWDNNNTTEVIGFIIMYFFRISPAQCTLLLRLIRVCVSSKSPSSMPCLSLLPSHSPFQQ